MHWAFTMQSKGSSERYSIENLSGETPLALWKCRHEPYITDNVCGDDLCVSLRPANTDLGRDKWVRHLYGSQLVLQDYQELYTVEFLQETSFCLRPGLRHPQSAISLEAASKPGFYVMQDEDDSHYLRLEKLNDNKLHLFSMASFVPFTA